MGAMSLALPGDALRKRLPVRPWRAGVRTIRLCGVTRGHERLPGEPETAREEGPTAAPAPPAAAALLALQRSAGNAAVTRVLARDPKSPTSLQFTQPAPAPSIGGPLQVQAKLPAEVEQAVDAYLNDNRTMIQMEVTSGTTSMPEVVDRVRRKVATAADADVFAIQMRVLAVVGAVPSTRQKQSLGGDQAQKAASIANRLPIPPTSVTISASKTSLKIEILGAELKTAKDGVHGTAKADKDGAEVEVKKGDVKAGASAKWDGSAFAVKTEVSGVKFGGKVERKGEGWKWSGGLVFQLAGDEVDELPDVSGVVAGAHGAIADSLGHLRSGGSPADDYVTSRMGQVKPAIDAIGKVAARSGKSGATLRVTASGEDGGFTAGVSLVIVF